MTDLEDRQQAELYLLHDMIARRDEIIARLTIERDAQARHYALLLHELQAAEARAQAAKTA